MRSATHLPLDAVARWTQSSRLDCQRQLENKMGFEVDNCVNLQEATQSIPGSSNLILSSIPEAERQRLLPFTSGTAVRKGEVIQERGKPIQQVAFVEQGTFALVIRTRVTGKTKGSGIVGREGFIGTSAVLRESSVAAHTAFALDGGFIRLIGVEALRSEIAGRSALHELCLSYMHTRMHQSLTLASCDHPLCNRLACWVLILCEWLGTDRLRITQQELAHQLLGTRRAGVTIVAHQLQAAGAITVHRSATVIQDKDRLQELACGCYQDVNRKWVSAQLTAHSMLRRAGAGVASTITEVDTPDERSLNPIEA